MRRQTSLLKVTGVRLRISWLQGRYSDGRNWISVKPDGQVPDALLRELLDKARNLMLSSFSKKRQREILESRGYVR